MLSPERWAKFREHAKYGAHAVATLADVENLQADIDTLRSIIAVADERITKMDPELLAANLELAKVRAELQTALK